MITTEVKAKFEARKEYCEAVANNQSALLFEQAKPDVFQIKVMNCQILPSI